MPLKWPLSRPWLAASVVRSMRVCGSCEAKAISRGATAGPSRLRAWPSNSRRNPSPGSKPGLSVTKALTVSPSTGSGMPITAASATAGWAIKAVSTSNGPIRWPVDLITSSARPTNQR